MRGRSEVNWGVPYLRQMKKVVLKVVTVDNCGEWK